MKFVFTFFIIIIAGFRLSAAARSIDTPKNNVFSFPKDTSSTVKPALHQDSLRLFTPINKLAYQTAQTENHSYNIKLVGFDKFPDSLRFPENRNLFALSNNFDKLKTPDSLSDLLVNTHADSLRMLAALKQADSLKVVMVAKVDSIKQHLKFMSLDSLTIELKANKFELLKAALYAEIASRYMEYDTISNKKQRTYYQNEAVSYTMKSLHQYSMYNDTTGLRNCFDNLATVYFAQKKYSQAKWFVLQSNSLARIKKDVPHIISSLLTLSAIKSEIQDYNLAMRDLNEALQLSIAYHYPKIESDVLRNFALLYSRLKNYQKEELVLKKRDSIEDSIRKEEEVKALDSINTQASAQKKKLDSLQKKKVFTSNIRKSYKNSSSKKTVSL